jgi:hypothetical protein
MSRWTTSSTLDHRSRKDCNDSRRGRSVSGIHWKVSRTGCTAMARRWSLIDSEQNRRVQRQRPEDTVTRARGRPESIYVYAVSRWGRSVSRRCCTSQSTYIYRAPQWMSPRWNWDSPTPFSRKRVCPPPVPKGGGAHSPAAKGVGESQF